MASSGRRPLVAAIDLDGTLLTTDKTVSERTISALRDWTAAGNQAIVVTARPPRSIRFLHDIFVDSGTAICSNGALIYDFVRDEVRTRRTLDDVFVLASVEKLRNKLVQGAFALEFGLHIARDPSFPLTDSPDHEVSTGDVRDLLDRPVAKLIVRDDTLDIQALHDLCVHVVGGEATVTHSGTEYVEISALGIDKANALAELCGERDITAEQVIAIGDMPNDLPTMQWAGRSIAMANAHDLVKAQANGVTLSNDDDGVAVALEALLREQRGAQPR